MPRASRPGSGRDATGARCIAAALALLACVPSWAQDAGPEPALGFSFTEVGEAAGLTAVTIFGGREQNRYLLETTGCGVALFDYDGDGWLDVFQVNGTTLEGGPPGDPPTNHLYRNLGNGRFEDVTRAAGLVATGWGQGACAGDLDNDGHEDLFVTYYGQNRMYRNRGDGTFADVTAEAGLTERRLRWGTGCAFLDHDRDGDLDVFVANYIDLDLEKAPTPDSGMCLYKGIAVACGPPGLPGGKNALYRNDGGWHFTDVSAESGIESAEGTYALGVSTLDFDDDGWVDLYVANDSNPSALYRNTGDGHFEDTGVLSGCAFSQDGKAQAGMGVAVGDFDRDGTMDLFKTNFAGDTSTLYLNRGDGFCEDRTFSRGIGVNTRWLGWGVGFVDLDNDGWLDLFLTNGHVYPEVAQLEHEAGYAQRKVVYLNQAGQGFADVTARLGPPVTTPRPGRGTAFGDLDNDGDLDAVVSNVHDRLDLYRLDSANDNHWAMLRLVGRVSNRSAIGARLRLTAGGARQVQEVRGGGSYDSQNDLRVHFGLGAADRIERLEVRWPNGLEEAWSDLPVDRILTLEEGTGAPLGEAGR